MNEILVYDIIGQGLFDAGVTAPLVKEQLDAMGGEDVTVRINSAGGDVFEGVTIANLLKEHSGKVTVKVDGYAASIASIIALAGDDIQIASNGMLMIHNPYSFAMGDADDLRKLASTLEKIKNTLVQTYTDATGHEPLMVSDWMDEETWFTAQEAVDLGFADSVTQSNGKVSNLSACRWINKAPDLLDVSQGTRSKTPHAEPEWLDYLAQSMRMQKERIELARVRTNLTA